MDKVFVTGISGLLGTNLVIMLIERGYFVTGLIRNKSNFLKPIHRNIKLIEGDLFDLKKITNGMEGCKYVVHTAANTSQRLLKLSNYLPTNVIGTENIIKACIQTKVEKLIYIGTANTFGYGNLFELGNESKIMQAPFTKSFYAISKKRAQTIIDKSTNKLTITTISPTFMIGAYDTKPSSGKIIQLALNKRFVFYPLGGKNFVHVADVAKAIIKAFDIRQSGNKYIIANENLTYKEFYKKLFLINNQKTTLIPIPNYLLFILGLIGDFLRFFKIQTNISSTNLRILTKNSYYTNETAKNELNMKFTPITDAISDWLEFHNHKLKNQQ